jgi:5-methylcytosine-specific restriction endonuclease McrA
MSNFETTPEYKKYINSAAWKRLRAFVIKHVGGCCQVCGISRYSVSLHVHHKTYERFKRERLSDLVVLCSKCHEKADKERRATVEAKSRHALYDARLDGWASKVYGEDWDEWVDYEYVTERFDRWLDVRGD